MDDLESSPPCGRETTLVRNNGSGIFTTNTFPFAVPLAPIQPIGSGFAQGMNLGDIDADGDLDLVCPLDRDTSPNPRGAHAVFINDGVGNSVEETATPFTVAGTDFYSGALGSSL